MSRNTMHSFTAQFSITTGTMLISEQIGNHVLTKTDQFMIPVNYEEIKCISMKLRLWYW